MLLHQNTLSVVLLIFVTATHHAAGVQIDSVGLTTGLPYVFRRSPAHINFSLTMEPEEALQSVVWQKDDGESRYEWQASGTVIVSGIFLGAINISAPNGELLFPQVQLDYAGHYNLTVFTRNGTDTATYRLIVYIIAEPCPEPDTKANLTYKFTTMPVKSRYGGYQQGVRVNYSCTDNPDLEPHKTVQCRSGGRWIETDITPWPNCNTPPETKEQPHSTIPHSTTSTLIIAEPCPEPDTKANQTYKFIILPVKSCYGEYQQSVMINYSGTDNTDLEPHKTVQCGSEGRWIETDITLWPNCNTTPGTTKTTQYYQQLRVSNNFP